MLETELPTPCYLMDQAKLKDNLTILKQLRKRSGIKILFAQKAFSSFPFYSMISRYLDGTMAASCYEAELAHLYYANWASPTKKGINMIISTAKTVTERNL